MYGFNTATAPIKIRRLFMKTSDVHSYNALKSESKKKKMHSQESVPDYGMRNHAI